ncbi:hypothetical protein SAMN05444159_4955 [Bradyrhizobium lablabi]|uniref:Uncharacterized protein n=1 Tax=Bradyrhizobium lablabi TaxID=722472 RepID=A0A1M6XRK2_9BRAD|nr:hypothetical protein [Bradyrhizobium lablabi]SHL08630.1 hypothetical protein SAMN05444159_4955 [Bradyrhizobium lablabi]
MRTELRFGGLLTCVAFGVASPVAVEAVELPKPVVTVNVPKPTINVPKPSINVPKPTISVSKPTIPVHHPDIAGRNPADGARKTVTVPEGTKSGQDNGTEKGHKISGSEKKPGDLSPKAAGGERKKDEAVNADGNSKGGKEGLGSGKIKASHEAVAAPGGTKDLKEADRQLKSSAIDTKAAGATANEPTPKQMDAKATSGSQPPLTGTSCHNSPGCSIDPATGALDYSGGKYGPPFTSVPADQKNGSVVIHYEQINGKIVGIATNTADNTKGEPFVLGLYKAPSAAGSASPPGAPPDLCATSLCYGSVEGVTYGAPQLGQQQGPVRPLPSPTTYTDDYFSNEESSRLFAQAAKFGLREFARFGNAIGRSEKEADGRNSKIADGSTAFEIGQAIENNIILPWINGTQIQWPLMRPSPPPSSQRPAAPPTESKPLP